MSLAVVRDLRVARPPATPEDLEALETDVLAGFVLARVATVGDGTVRRRCVLRQGAAPARANFAEHGLRISAGKMSGLWSGDPASIKLADLNVICTVLGCGVEELLIPETEKVKRVDEPRAQPTAASASGGPSVTPKL